MLAGHLRDVHGLDRRLAAAGVPDARRDLCRTLDASGIAAAVAAAAEGTSPATDSLASTWYRREVVGVHLRRLLLGQDA